MPDNDQEQTQSVQYLVLQKWEAKLLTIYWINGLSMEPVKRHIRVVYGIQYDFEICENPNFFCCLLLYLLHVFRTYNYYSLLLVMSL